ncbi:serine/threonine protein kinase [Synechococcus elongatus]|uniref:serine/threonine protein kinase n=1 Tax=Synechococcus elongatus TaxID=32046 RepID=UPI000F7EA65D|nr:serine/threonine-protein kinase [Synechococcus elongatus]
MSRLPVGTVLNDRYELDSPLGQGGTGTTYRAHDRQSQQTVAIKILTLSGTTDWKILDLFEREARILATLQHPGIPHYRDYFQTETSSDCYFCLVRDLVEGQPLDQLVEQGARLSEEEVVAIAAQVLEILVYLQSLYPPLVHRDIKPQNLIRQTDGQLQLIDFGSVQAIARETLLGSNTFVGTLGYMPPEQLQGQSSPQSDLYAVGATLVFLLTGRSPDQLQRQRLRIDFRPYAKISDRLATWLDQLLAPLPEERFGSAAIALQALKVLNRPSFSPSAIASSSSDTVLSLRKPAGSKVELTRSPQRLRLRIPPQGLRLSLLGLAGFALFWNVLLVFFTATFAVSAPLFLLFLLPFWYVGIMLMAPLCLALFGQTILEIGRDRFQLHMTALGISKTLRGQTDDINAVEVAHSGIRINDVPLYTCVLQVGINRHQFGFMLTTIEQDWIAAELQQFLQQLV